MQHRPLVSEKTETALRETFRTLQSDRPVRVPSERELAERMAVSRVSIRKALAVLVAEGLLEQRQGMGTYVLPRPAIRELHLLRSPEIKHEDPFYLQLLSAIATRAASAGIRLTLLDVERLREPTADTGSREEPLVLLGPVPEDLTGLLAARYGRVVSVHGGHHVAGETEVRFDDRHIGREAAHLLLARGHNRLALLSGPTRYDSARERREGFLEAAERMHRTVRIVEEKMNWGGGIRAAESMLAERAQTELPDAVFAANDWMALGFIQRMRADGVRVPEDIAVIGCDNLPLSAEFDPPLATFAFDMERLVAEIADCVFGRESAGGGRRILLPATFVPRASLEAVPPDRPRPPASRPARNR